MNSMIRTLRKIPLIHQIAVGLIIGILIAVFLPGAVPVVGIFGDLFVRALKGVAPLLVFILVMNAMVQRKEGGDTQMKPIITLYVIGTFAASIVGVVLSFLFPQTLMLQLGNAKVNPPSGIAEVVHNLVLNIVDNPLNAILNANYIGILAWAVIIGLALHKAASPETKHVLEDLSAGITKVVTWVIHFAPLGIMGLVTQSISASGLSALISYFSLLGVLLGRFICGFLCPFGWLQDLLHKIPSPKLSTRRLKPLRYIKYAVLLIMVVLLPAVIVNTSGMGDPFFCKYLCPQGVLEGAIPLSLTNAGIRAALGKLFSWKFCILLAVVVGSVVFYRPFCKWLCPLGAVYALMNHVSLFQMRVDRDTCVSCGACAKACPMDVDITRTPNHAECIRCGKCIKSCPTKAICYQYGFGDKSKTEIKEN